MGIDDLIPDNVEMSSGGQNKEKSEPDFVEYKEVFHSNHGEKKYTEKQWNNIKDVIRKHYPHTVHEVKNMNPEKRHDILHEVSIKANTEGEIEETPETTDMRCAVCNTDCSGGYVIIDGERVHVMHNVMQVADALDKEVKSINNENS